MPTHLPSSTSFKISNILKQKFYVLFHLQTLLWEDATMERIISDS